MKVLSALFLFMLATQVSFAQKKTPHINHVALSVTDLSKSRIFYQEVIGLDTIAEPFHDGRHIWLSIGDHSHLHLIQNPPPVIVPSKNTHLCFSVASMDKIIDILKKRSIAFEDWPGKPSAITTRVDGIHQIYLKDPDGFWVEINDDY